MFDAEEKELEKLNQFMKDMPKPDNINEYIQKGMAHGIKKKKRNRIKVFSNIAAASIIAVFLTLIRTVPAFADYVTKIPGLEYIVTLINYDKGLKSAIENNFIQNINSSLTYNDLTFTVKAMILDSSKGIIFYTIENKGNHHFVNLDSMKFLDENGQELKAGVSWGSPPDKDMSIEKRIDGKVDIDFSEDVVLPEKIKIEVKLRDSTTPYNGSVHGSTVLTPVWTFNLPVDREKIMTMQKTYELNKNIDIEGQKILFKDVTITPTKIALNVEYDKNNTKKIFRYDDIKFVNEKGEDWASITNGIISSSKDENHEVLYFQSNYFTNPKELYLTGSSIRAFDKDKCKVEVDMENSTLLKAPNDRLSLVGIDLTSSSTTLNFNLKVDNPLDKGFSYNIFNTSLLDSSNNAYTVNSAGSTSTINGKQDLNLTINKALNLKNHVYLSLNDYPERIKGEFKVRIK